MSVLQKIKQMRQQGKADSEIITSLEEQGASPREINESLAQSKIKQAIIGNGYDNLESTQEINSYGNEMQSSIMNQQNENIPEYNPESREMSVPIPQKTFEQESFNQQETNQSAQNNQYFQEQSPYGYEGQGYSEYQGENSTDIINEIASQIVEEKLSKSKKLISDLTEFKVLSDAKVQKIDERLMRIESIIDSLQSIVLRKANDQSQNIEDIKSEMRGMQVGFSKVLNPLVDKARHKQTKSKKISKKKK